MELHTSREDYLEAILVLGQQKGEVHSVDVARYLNYSKPSVSRAVGLLRQGGFLEMDGRGCLELTEKGREEAERIYERHVYFARRLKDIGVDPAAAEEEACLIEHVISQDTFEKIKAADAERNK